MIIRIILSKFYCSTFYFQMRWKKDHGVNGVNVVLLVERAFRSVRAIKYQLWMQVKLNLSLTPDPAVIEIAQVWQLIINFKSIRNFSATGSFFPLFRDILEPWTKDFRSRNKIFKILSKIQSRIRQKSANSLCIKERFCLRLCGEFQKSADKTGVCKCSRSQKINAVRIRTGLKS